MAQSEAAVTREDIKSLLFLFDTHTRWFMGIFLIVISLFIMSKKLQLLKFFSFFWPFRKYYFL